MAFDQLANLLDELFMDEITEFQLSKNILDLKIPGWSAFEAAVAAKALLKAYNMGHQRATRFIAEGY